MKGELVVIDGMDGSGKTTLIGMLGRALVEAGRDVHLTHEPSEGVVGLLLREYLDKKRTPLSWSAMALLFAADRVEHIDREILPAMKRGKVVLCDRYIPSNLAYQTLFEEHTSDGEVCDAMSWIERLNEHALIPDLTIMLDVDPEVAERRRIARGLPETLFEKRELQRRLRERFGVVPQFLSGAWRMVDASGTPEQTFGEVWPTVKRAVGLESGEGT